jgi:hypothetical protein
MRSSFTLAPEEESALLHQVGKAPVQLVWDLNAVFFVGVAGTLTVETFADCPTEVASDEFDEVVFIRVSDDARGFRFCNEGEDGYWYRVVANNSPILSIEVARTCTTFPSGDTVSPASAECCGRSVLTDAGIIITLAEGIVPAVQLGTSFGYAVWPEPRLYSRDEVMETLGADFEIRLLGPAA